MPERNLDVFGVDPLPKEIDTVIIGVDPGVTTGVSVIAYNSRDFPASPGDVPFWGSSQKSYGGSGNVSDVVGGPMVEQRIARDIADIALCLVDRPDVRIIFAIEDFIIRKVNTSRDFLAPVRITSGILQEITGERFKNRKIEVSIQAPSDAKVVCKDERMNTWGFTIKTQRDRHSRDADRHSVLCLRYLMEKRNRSFSAIETS